MKMSYGCTARNVNGMLAEATWQLATVGIKEESRNGPVMVYPGPTLLHYLYPTERVLFNATRDANPYFHLMESLWMLAGREDVEFVRRFNSKIGDFSDDGVVMPGAYGHRWRNYFGADQLELIIAHLKKTPTSRRAVLQMWDVTDLQKVDWSKDVPCNTQAYFTFKEGQLDMTVCNRSNDLVWGACGANAVHMSLLQEYIACSLQVEVGSYYQFSNNLHMYTERYDPEQLKADYYADDRYLGYNPAHEKLAPLLLSRDAWDEDLRRFMSDPLGDTAYKEPFFNDVAAPMYASWHDRKSKHNTGTVAAHGIAAWDWREACFDWIARREVALTKTVEV